MNYLTANIPAGKLPRIAALPIHKQSEITKQFGAPLQLGRMMQLIKEITKNYTLDIPLAKESDALLHKALTQKGFFKSSDKVKASTRKNKPTTKQLTNAEKSKVADFREQLAIVKGYDEGNLVIGEILRRL